MELNAKNIVDIFIQSVKDWHKNEKPSGNPYKSSPEDILYKKNQIDTIQWHVEDEIRRQDISDSELVGFKRQIDKLNQERTDTVELLDDLVFEKYRDVKKSADAKMNSETPAWLIDRMSILELKIYHMEEQTARKDASAEHVEQCANKLKILLEQRKDLSVCLDDLFSDLASGKKFMKVYRQMKMYNDKNLNPSLYQKTK